MFSNNFCRRVTEMIRKSSSKLIIMIITGYRVQFMVWVHEIKIVVFIPLGL